MFTRLQKSCAKYGQIIYISNSFSDEIIYFCKLFGNLLSLFIAMRFDYNFLYIL